MKRKIVLISFAFLSLIFLNGCFRQKQNQVCFENNCFNVELALTQNEQSRGLMFRENLESNKGMLFIFAEEKIHSFWMKNTLIPLDIIWLDENKNVVFIKKDARPCDIKNCPSINPEAKAKYVLELNSGIADKIGLSLDDKINFDLK